MERQSPKCLGIPMRVPTKIQLQAPPAHQWELRLPGIPFEVHVCDSGRWVITSGRDSVAYGSESDADRAAEVAGNVLIGWANGILSLIPKAETVAPEPAKPFVHPMAVTVEEPKVTETT